MISAMSILALITTLPLLTVLGWLLLRWVQADSLHPRAKRPEWFD